jgi:branched-chain amino acid transport system ATP-binding protein
MLQIHQLHAYYGKSHVLQGVNFEVKQGEIVALLGRNGSGRSTTAKAIMGLVHCEGEMHFKGQSLLHRKPFDIAHMGLGYVPENRDIFPKLTVHQNLLLGLKGDKPTGRWDFEDMYTLFPRLRERQHTEAGVLSGGERNRLNLALTLKLGGNLLLLDEPTNDLDVETLGSLENALLEFPGCAVVISHDRWFLDRVATHILAYEGESKWFWFEGNFESYEANKIERLGADAARPHRATYRKLTR